MKVSNEKKVISSKPFAMISDELNSIEEARYLKMQEVADLGLSGKTFPTNSLKLGFVNLNGDSRPKSNTRYQVVSAGNSILETIPYPQTQYKRLDVDLYAFYIDDLPDFTRTNEGLLKISVNTKNPQDLASTEGEATMATNFTGKDGTYAPAFLYKGTFRNVLFEKWINLQFDLFELDTDADKYFAKVKQVINGVPEAKNLDVLKGIPYLNLASSLFESIITTFGRNPDDHVWGEIPILSIIPTIGGAFLRDGVYVLFEEVNSKGQKVSFSNLEYLNERIVVKKNTKKVSPNHLIFGIQLNPHQISNKIV